MKTIKYNCLLYSIWSYEHFNDYYLLWLKLLLCGRQGFTLWVRKIPGEGYGYPLQYFCLKNSMERSLVNYSSWVTKSWTRLSILTLMFWLVSLVSSVAQSCPILCDPVNRSTPGLPVHHQLLQFTQTHVHHQWCHPAISSSAIPEFSSCPQSLSASGSFPMSQLFAWGGKSIEVSASASVLPMNTQDWSSLGWTGWISLQSKGLSRLFSNTTVQKHQFFCAQLSSQTNSHIHTWPLETP